MISRTRVALTICLVAVLGLAALGATAAARDSTTIKVGDDFFSPDRKTVSAGTKVRFKWVGSDEHNVVKAKGPGGGFESGTTDARGVNFKKKFKKRGNYKIICTIHDEMKLSLKVD